MARVWARKSPITGFILAADVVLRVLLQSLALVGVLSANG